MEVKQTLSPLPDQLLIMSLKATSSARAENQAGTADPYQCYATAFDEQGENIHASC